LIPTVANDLPSTKMISQVLAKVKSARDMDYPFVSNRSDAYHGLHGLVQVTDEKSKRRGRRCNCMSRRRHANILFSKGARVGCSTRSSGT
jgi:hypothetical protein